MNLNKNELELIIDAFMAEISANIPLIKSKNQEILSECFDEINEHWSNNSKKVVNEVCEYLKDVNKIIID